MYINCKTFFSYRYGTYSTEELVNAAEELGVTSMAITNINNTADCWSFYQLCKQKSIKPVLGVEVRNEDTYCYLLLARNNKGFEQINRFVSYYLINKIAFPEIPSVDENVNIIYPLPDTLRQYKANEYIGIKAEQVNKLFGKDIEAIKNHLIIQQPVTYQNKKYYYLHCLLRAIDKNIVLSKLQPEQAAGKQETFIKAAQLLSSYNTIPEIITNTYRLIDDCNVSIELHQDKNKKYFTASKEDDADLLSKLALDGLQYRYGRNKAAKERVLKELKIINELNFNAYFLITWDMLQYAKLRGFYHVGRGSGANSIVAYCLQITDVDPIELDLYFERFLNPSRTSPPDFDIDFSWADRDEIIDYMFKRYGKDHVCLLGMFSTFQFNASVRELGKVYGLPKSEIDQMAEGNFSKDKIHTKILYNAKLLQNFPNHLSIHPGGILITEEPVYAYTALEKPPKNFNVAQFDMFVAEDIGVYKFDVLSQRGLGHIKDTIQLVRQTRGVDIDIHNVESFKKDKNVAENIRNSNTVGCFYIESPAMRQLLKKLKCDDYTTLVAASSIIRPGVGQSGMMQEYIKRHHNPDKFEYLHPLMKELLQETYGVMVYQEDVIKVAHHFAGLDLEEADILRRAMSGKYRGNKEMQRIEAKFFMNCKQKEHPEHIAKEVWRQIASFAGYSFSKAHSASFAVESYQSLFLKTYYPVEFMVAVINNFGGFYNRELYFQQLKKTGVKVELPCINNSVHLTNIKDGIVYMGFIHIKNLDTKTITDILEERVTNGQFLHLQDFLSRIPLGTEQINLLIKIDAFRFTGINKKELLWHANFLSRPKELAVSKTHLFEEEPVNFTLPDLSQTAFENMLDEINIMGFTIHNVFDMIQEDMTLYPKARDISLLKGQTVTCVAYLVCTKYASTKKDNRTMYFGTWLDANGDWLDTVHFPNSASAYPFSKRGFYKFTGEVAEEFGAFSINVSWMQKIGHKNIS